MKITFHFLFFFSINCNLDNKKVIASEKGTICGGKMLSRITNLPQMLQLLARCLPHADSLIPLPEYLKLNNINLRPQKLWWTSHLTTSNHPVRLELNLLMENIAKTTAVYRKAKSCFYNSVHTWFHLQAVLHIVILMCCA